MFGLFVEINFVTEKVEKHLQLNKRGNIDVDFHFTSNGYGYKRICQRLYFALLQGSWIANQYLLMNLQDLTIEDIINTPASQLNIDMKILVPTMKIALKYSAHKCFRRAWAGLWSSHLPKVGPNMISQRVLDIKAQFRKGFNMLRCLAPEMVCYCIYVFVLILS